jgi:hypothetical protein
MKVELLEADLDELRELEIEPQTAFDRGCAAIGNRRTHDRLHESPSTGLAELVDLFAERAADTRLIRFSYATKNPEYERSAQGYDEIEGVLRELRREVAPRLRARLRELRAREAELERELALRGVDPTTIGPLVPPGTAIDPTPKPGEGPERRRQFPRLPPRKRLIDRLLRR